MVASAEAVPAAAKKQENENNNEDVHMVFAVAGRLFAGPYLTIGRIPLEAP